MGISILVVALIWSGLRRLDGFPMLKHIYSSRNGRKSCCTENNNAIRQYSHPLFSVDAKLIFNKLGNEEHNPDADKDKLCELLDSYPTKIFTIDELNSKWIDICIDESRPNDLNSFTLVKIIPYLLQNHLKIQIVDENFEQFESIEDSEVFITEAELRNLWQLKSMTALGKPIESFDVQTALLLVEDESDENNSEIDIHSTPSEASISLLSSSTSTQVHSDEIDDGPELYITLQELKRIWDKRAEIPWGLPAQTFDELSALLLLDDDDDEGDDDVEYVPAVLQGVEKDDVSEVIGLLSTSLQFTTQITSTPSRSYIGRSTQERAINFFGRR